MFEQLEKKLLCPNALEPCADFWFSSKCCLHFWASLSYTHTNSIEG